jgi:hypothetical protein
VNELAEQLTKRMVASAARHTDTLSAEASTSLLSWLTNGTQPREDAWMTLTAALDGKDSPLLRAALSHPSRLIRERAWRRANLPYEVTLELLREERVPAVRIAAVFAHDPDPTDVMSLLPSLDYIASEAVIAHGGQNPERLPLALWGIALRHLSPSKPAPRERECLGLALDWEDLNRQTLADPHLPARVRLLAACSRAADSDLIGALLEALRGRGPSFDWQLRELTDVLIERDDLPSPTYGYLLELVRADGMSSTGALRTRERLIDRRMEAGCTAPAMADRLAGCRTEDELLAVADSVPSQVWEGKEYWRSLTGSQHAGARVYALVRTMSSLRHADVYSTMPEGWDVWQDAGLAIDMLSDQMVSGPVLLALTGPALVRLKEQLLTGAVRPTGTLWRLVKDWFGDEAELARLVPVREFADARPGSAALADAVSALLLPAATDPVGQGMLESFTEADQRLTAGEAADLYAAATLA